MSREASKRCQRSAGSDQDGGISETSTITVTFDREIYFGEGHIVIRPGGQAALTEVARSSMWFRVQG
eukprot:g24627.t1